MKLCTTQIVTGPTGKQHFAVVAAGQPGWPLALCGPVDGPLAKQSEAEAKLFADAPVMLDMLEVLVREFSNVNPIFPLSEGKLAELKTLTERASGLCAKHIPPPKKRRG